MQFLTGDAGVVPAGHRAPPAGTIGRGWRRGWGSDAPAGGMSERGAPVKMWTDGVPVEDEAKAQLLRTANLPFVYRHVAVMPDVHLAHDVCIGTDGFRICREFRQPGLLPQLQLLRIALFARN